jgi:hypothetical protein
MWVQERELGEVLERREREDLLATAHELVRARLPKKLRMRVEASPRGARSSPRGRAASRRRRG